MIIINGNYDKEYIPAGFIGIAKTTSPDYWGNKKISEVCSVSECINGVQCDWIAQWLHNGYWHFNNVTDLKSAYSKCGVLSGYEILYLEIYKSAYDNLAKKLIPIWIEDSFQTNVTVPFSKDFIGRDVIRFSGRSSAECSLISCNNQIELFKANKYSLTDMNEIEIIDAISSYVGDIGEPGPYKIYKVFKIAQQGDAPETGTC